MKEVDSMKRNRRILSLLLAVCLVIALIPAVFAAEEATLAESAVNDQIVSFAGKEWIVIDNSSDAITLLLRDPELAIPYSLSGLSNSWDDSDAKIWCEKFATENNIPFEVTFLSHEELVTYWVNNSADNLRTTSGWWLRYNGDNVGGDLFGIAVSDAGFVGFPHVATNYGARPAVKVDPSKVAAMIDSDSDGVLELKVIDNAFASTFAPVVTVDEVNNKATVSYSNYEADSLVYVLITDQLGQVVSCISSSADDNAIEVAIPESVGRYTIRVFNEKGGVASNITEHEFSVADDLGNVIEWSLNVSDAIRANFNIALDETLDESATKILATSNGVTREYFASDLEDVMASDGVTACLRLPVDMLAPQMANTITIKIVSGEKEGGNQRFTIRQYGEAIVNGEYPSTTKNLVKHMLNYGAKAQTYFNYNTGNLANAKTGVPAQEKVPAPDANTVAKVNGEVDGIVASGVSLVLNSKTTLRFYFKLTGEKAISEFNFGELTVNKRYNEDNLYFVDINEIAPHQLDEEKTVTVSGADGTFTVTYSPMVYIRKFANGDGVNENLKNLLVAMYNYNLAADAWVSAK